MHRSAAPAGGHPPATSRTGHPEIAGPGVGERVPATHARERPPAHRISPAPTPTDVVGRPTIV